MILPMTDWLHQHVLTTNQAMFFGFLATMFVLPQVQAWWRKRNSSGEPDAPPVQAPPIPAGGQRHLNFVIWLGYVNCLAMTVVCWQARAAGSDKAHVTLYLVGAFLITGLLIALSSLWWVYGEHGLISAYPDATEAQLQSQVLLAWAGLVLSLAGVAAAVLVGIGRLDMHLLLYTAFGGTLLQGLLFTAMNRLARYAGDRPLW